MRNLLTGPKILETRVATVLALLFWDFVAEQSRSGFLFLVLGRVSNFDCLI